MEAANASSALSENKGHYLGRPLNRCAAKHHSYMGAAWKPKIDPLSSEKRSTFDGRKDQIKGGCEMLESRTCSFYSCTSQAAKGELQ